MKRPAVEWLCSICMFVETGSGGHDELPRALTIINGQLVCGQHYRYAQGEPHTSALRLAFEAEQ